MSQLSQSRDRISFKGLALSETEQLQKDIDDFTKLLEKEKRQLMITEDQIKQVSQEIAEKNANIEKIKKVEGRKPIQDKRDKIEMAANTHKTKHATIKMNVTKTEN
jgi:hypothetical protein